MNTRMIAGGLALIVALTGCAVPMSQLSLWQPLVDTGQISDRYYRCLLYTSPSPRDA